MGPFGLSFTPVVSSGGKYDFSGRQNNLDLLKHDVVVMQLGARYCGYNAVVQRTIMINPDHEVRSVYNAMLICL